MNIVIDTSAIIAVIANEPERATLIQKTQGATLIAPKSVEWEIGNAFSAMLKRKRIVLEQAIASISVYKQIPIRFVDVELDEALKLAGDLNIYAYDAYLIRCALKYKYPLLTLDNGLRVAAEKMDISIIEV